MVEQKSFHSLKLWFVIRSYGVEGLRYHVRRHVELAQNFARSVEEDEHFELAAPAPLNLVCFRHVGGDAVNQRLLHHLARSGSLYLTHTVLDGRFTLRLCVGQTHTETRHVQRAWQTIQQNGCNARNSIKTCAASVTPGRLGEKRFRLMAVRKPPFVDTPPSTVA
ncbi:MAG: pyridoxal-dependent decarboxylase [Syntrophobacteria bacterium]